MKADAYVLVLVSAVMHAYWNFLLKKAGGSQIVVALSKIAEAALFAPLFLFFSLGSVLRSGAAAVPLVLVGAAFTLANYGTLALAYRHGDLSVVYPVARGSMLAFLPALGWLFLRERLDATGWIALAIIVTGILTVQLPSLSRTELQTFVPRLLRSRAALLALLAGLSGAGYTLWDKHAVSTLQPFAYMYLYTVLVALVYTAFIRAASPAGAIAAEWRAHRSAILAIGILNTTAYLLVLLALRAGVSSYVIGLRQLSVAFGVLLGWRLLREPLNAGRKLGVALIVLGSLLLSFAR